MSVYRTDLYDGRVLMLALNDAATHYYIALMGAPDNPNGEAFLPPPYVAISFLGAIMIGNFFI
mgnify:FL=1